jgi:hypothetical protein
VCRGLKRSGRSFTGQGGGAIRRGAQFGRTSDAEAEAEAEPLGGEGMLLGGAGEVVAMAVKELPHLVWRTFAEQCR